MVRKVLQSKGFWAVLLPIVMAGAAFAGGADCAGHQKTVAEAGHGSHCHLLAKNVKKSVEVLDDGVVVTLKGTSDEAVEHIKEHLNVHASGTADCPDCPLTMKGVTTKVDITDDGGTITAEADNADAVAALKEWAKKPVGACCNDAAKKGSKV